MLSDQDLNKLAAAERKAITGLDYLDYDGAEIAREFEKMLRGEDVPPPADTEPLNTEMSGPEVFTLNQKIHRAGKRVMGRAAEHSLEIAGIALCLGTIALRKQAIKRYSL